MQAHNHMVLDKATSGVDAMSRYATVLIPNVKRVTCE